jgi:hypothetical protein
MMEVFAWGEELWQHHGLYSSSIKKAVRYFMTDIEIVGDNMDYHTRRKYKEILESNFQIYTDTATIGDDYMALGNAFVSMHVPFIRYLTCPDCNTRAPIQRLYEEGDLAVRFENRDFSGQCPNCRHSVKYIRQDLREPLENKKPILTRWPPQYLRLKQHPITRHTKYYLDTPKYTQLYQGVKKGDPLYLAETPWELLEAILDNRRFEFTDNFIYHMSNPSISCCLPNLQGWGLPPFMAEFETAILVMLLDKYNEAILVDYLVPFRVLAPPSGRGGAPSDDPLLNINVNTYIDQIKGMLANHRRNPTGWHFLPYPVEYQVLGGEASRLTPVQMMEHFESRLLNSMGIPQEFYSSSINAAGPIIGFKMFERSWQYFADELNGFLTWTTQRLGELLTWEKVSARLSPVSVYEDPELRAIKLELAASGQVSKETAFKSIHLSPEYERKRIMEEEDEFSEMMAQRAVERAKKDSNLLVTRAPSPAEDILQQQQMAAMPPGAPGAAAPPPGAPPPPPTGAATGPSIDELLFRADTEAQQIIAMEPTARRSYLIGLKKSDAALHAQVTARLEQLEYSGERQGLQMVRTGQLPPQ